MGARLEGPAHQRDRHRGLAGERNRDGDERLRQRLQPTTLRGTSGLSYNANNQRTPSTRTWAYDGMGNPTTYRGRTNTYDLPGRMATTRDGNTSVGYTYRADGLMASRAKSIYVLLFGNWVEIMEQPKFYLHDGGEPVLEMDLGTNYSTLGATNVRGPDGLVARRQNGNWIYYEFDGQGSVSQRLDAAGNVLSSSVYDAYGAETNSGTPTDPFGYNAQWGYWLDRDTGLYLCQARWYDPVTGRWVTRDPIGYAGGANLYAYCGGGPVGKMDRLGRQGDSVHKGAALADALAETGAPGALEALSGGASQVSPGIIAEINAIGAGAAAVGATGSAAAVVGAIAARGSVAILLTLLPVMVYDEAPDPCDVGTPSLIALVGALGDPLMPDYRRFIERQQPQRHAKDDCDYDFETMLDYIQNLWLRRLIGSVNRRVLRELAFRKYAECRAGAVL